LENQKKSGCTIARFCWGNGTRKYLV